MATNLTPEQLAQLQRLFSTPVDSGGDGNAYMPNTVDYGGQTYKQDNAGGFVGTGPLYGDKQYHFNNYDTSGAQTAEGEAQMSKWSPEMDFLKAMGALVGGGLAMGGPAGFGFGGAGGAGGSLAGDAFLPGALGVDGAAMGSGVLPGLEGYLAGGTGAMGAGGAGAGAGGGGGGLSLAGDATLPGQLGVNGANMSTAAIPGLEGYVTGTTGLLGGLGGKALGIGASLLGGALGSQGQQAEQSSTRDIPEWLKPYAQKVLGYGGTLLDAQMQPGAMAGFDQMKTVGRGLLGQPIAGNGTSLFPARPTLMRR